MDSTKVTSVRMDESLYLELMKRARELTYYKRNAIINALVYHCLNSLSNDDLRKVLWAKQSQSTSLKLGILEYDRQKR